MVRVDIMKKLDWDREWTGKELILCNRQGTLFERCQYEFKCDAFDYVEKFMNSDIALNMDKNDSDYYFKNTTDFIEAVRGKIPLVELKEEKYPEAFHWIGYVYRKWAYMGMTSKEIIRVFPVEAAYEAYNGLHTLDVMEAIRIYVERWMKHYVKDSA